MKRLLFILFTGLVMGSCDYPYDQGKKAFEDGDYSVARYQFNKVTPLEDHHDSARFYLNKLDSIDDEKLRQERSEQYERLVNSYKQEIESIGSFQPSTEISRDNVMIDLAVIGAWTNYVLDAEKHDSIEIKELGQKMKSRLIACQKRVIPKLRSNYAKALDKFLWENDIDVEYKGNATIELVGGIFATNKNISDTQTALSDQLYNLRFRRSQYKWYDRATEYTYYTIKSPGDSEIAKFR